MQNKVGVAGRGVSAEERAAQIEFTDRTIRERTLRCCRVCLQCLQKRVVKLL